ncbi:hypothetical protein [Stutzerimonas nitrititolerans]|uniref:hypothetical protein n=1 Tax=Stutzerimonas nitrititolerans TaxID=2482751 RepID=UPI0028A891F7|nr:hypothetical protein [Stutzerimonas nitrititolerans]
MAYVSAASSPAHFEAFKTILKACLVSGYGTIPAAGWDLVYEADNALVLRPGSGSGYVCFQRESSISLVTVWLSSTYAGVDAGGRLLGDGVKSGTAASNSVPQRFSVRSFVAYAASSTWALVADAKTFVVSLSGSNRAQPFEVTGSEGSTYEANHTLYVGEDSSGDLISVGGVNTTSNSSSGPTVGFNAAGFTALKFPDTGLLVDTSSIGVAMPGASPASSSDFNAFPTGVVFPDVSLSPVYWIANGVVRKLRGLAVDPRFMSAYNSSVAQALGGPALTTRTMNTIFELDDGHAYLVGRSYSVSVMSMLLTTNPEFW